MLLSDERFGCTGSPNLLQKLSAGNVPAVDKGGVAVLIEQRVGLLTPISNGRRPSSSGVGVRRGGVGGFWQERVRTLALAQVDIGHIRQVHLVILRNRVQCIVEGRRDRCEQGLQRGVGVGKAGIVVVEIPQELFHHALTKVLELWATQRIDSVARNAQGCSDQVGGRFSGTRWAAGDWSGGGWDWDCDWLRRLALF